jgi:ABC-2 type transport system permease protein
VFVVSVVLASIVGFAIRFCSAVVTFWLLDSRGVDQMVTLLISFFAGLLLPVNLFPDWLETLARALPFAAMVQSPAEIYLGLHDGPGMLAILAQQALWACGLGLLGRLLLASASRRLVAQGG